MRKYREQITLSNVPAPTIDYTPQQVVLTDETMAQRRNKVLALMKQKALDRLLVYADLEHGSNFEYLTGFLPRFEEALLVLHQDGNAYMLMGNENAKMVRYARLQAQLIHVPFFSLPNQPMEDDENMATYLKMAGIEKGQRIGVAGWKNFTSKVMDNRYLFDLPYYIVDAVLQLAGKENVVNGCDVFIGTADGARCVNNTNEIAHYAYGAALSGEVVFEAIDAIHVDMRECDIGSYLGKYGQRHSVVSIAATGERFDKANLYPSEKRVQLGDKLSVTSGFKGGITSRTGYAVEREDQLPDGARDYIERLAKPYFATVTAWIENIRPGMTGGELYDLVEQVLPKDTYHWSLNPGHLVADEEWMCSPVYPGSADVLKSGMLLQIDIIPSVPGLGGTGCESAVALADETLRAELECHYPALYRAFQARRAYLKDVLGIAVPEWVLPLSDTVAYYRPFFLNRQTAFVKKSV